MKKSTEYLLKTGTILLLGSACGQAVVTATRNHEMMKDLNKARIENKVIEEDSCDKARANYRQSLLVPLLITAGAASYAGYLSGKSKEESGYY